MICGSRTDLPALEEGAALLEQLGVTREVRVISAHRAPELLDRYVADASERGARVFVCAAGLAAHLAGAVAARTAWPVIGVPMPGGLADGLDALLATVQMPKGVPVATVAVAGAENAAILAAQILALSDARLADKLAAFKNELETKAVAADEKLQKARTGG
jgi:5-(carboxyamino)imidazole ribonucleotide mutase